MTNYKGIDYGLGRTNKHSVTGIRFGVIPQNDVLQAWADSSEPYYGQPTCPECGAQAVEGESKSRQLDGDGGVEVWTEHAPERQDFRLYRRHSCGDYACDNCQLLFDGESAFAEEPTSFSYDEDGYHAECGQDGDIFITESPYFTYAQFCSPCAPGACYLRNPLEEPSEDNRAYCFGHDWFEDGRAPYPVYSVATGELVNPQ